MKDSRPVLLVEDDSIDAMTVQRAFRDLKVTNPLKRTVNGEDALAYLRNPANDKPCVILLDLNMPKLDGREVLRQMADYPNLRRIATVVLTTSSQEQDILYSYDLGAKSYIAKPENLERYESVLRVLEHYWFHIVLLPPRESD